MTRIDPIVVILSIGAIVILLELLVSLCDLKSED